MVGYTVIHPKVFGYSYVKDSTMQIENVICKMSSPSNHENDHISSYFSHSIVLLTPFFISGF